MSNFLTRLILVYILIFGLAGCLPKAGNILPTAAVGLESGNPSSHPPTKGTPVATSTATAKPTEKPTSKPNPDTCKGETNVMCLDGYSADPNPKDIPSKVIFLNPVGSSLTNTPQQDAQSIISQANNYLVSNNHRFLKFADPTFELQTAPANFSSIMNSNYMISNYGVDTHYVLILVKDMINKTGGIIGYSPGLRINFKTKNSIVVMDYDYVMKDPKGKNVIIHELFHGLGAPHTTDANGGQDNQLPNGLLSYSGIGLVNSTMPYQFQIYIEDRPSYEGVVNFGNYSWDTRTLMMWYATGHPLFVNGASALNASYSNILNVYYQSFVK